MVVSGVFTARVVRPRTWIEFMEGLNLFMMYVTALGLTSAIILTDFFEHVIFDTMRMKDRTWQYAHELMLVMFRRIEDSAGRLNLGNVYDSVHLNSLLEETDRNLAHFYPTQADCFRTHGANPGAETGDNKLDTKSTAGVKWNNKFSSSNSRPCAAFNGNRVHNANELLPDGTCKRNHVCDQWVDNKGKDGKCLCEKGAHGHSRAKCDHPNKSDRIV